jgi:hypothetical protein
MRKQLTATLVAVIATLVLGIGIAVAVEGGSNHASQVPAASSDSAATDAGESDEAKSDDTESDHTESADTESDAPDGSASDHPDNHGKYVSEAAQSCPPGPGHGACVSAVAHSDQGKKTK